MTHVSLTEAIRRRRSWMRMGSWWGSSAWTTCSVVVAAELAEIAGLVGHHSQVEASIRR